MPVITLLTDFGDQDGYVGVLKGVILSIAPHTQIIDISHEIAPCDIKSGAWVLNNSYRYFPAGTTHLCVVDPGVGSDRRPLILLNPEHGFVGPDNGIFSDVITAASEWEAFRIDKPQFWRPNVSNTFHGRDIFAPVAAYLSTGMEPRQLASEVSLDSIHRFKHPNPAKFAGRAVGLVVHIDTFGNLITNIDASELQRASNCLLAGREIPLGITYGSAKPGEAVAYAGSHGCLEIGVFQGRADTMLDAKRGTHVTLVLKD